MKLKNITDEKIRILFQLDSGAEDFISIKPGESFEMSAIGLESENVCKNCGAE